MHSIPGFSSIPLKISQLSLPAVLKCGQSFRWQSIDLKHANTVDAHPTKEWRLTLTDRVVCLRQTPDALFYRTVASSSASLSEEERDRTTLAWIKDYFQLDIDLDDLYNDWTRRDPVFAKVKDRFSGIRILRQDPWENVISFICSQNNHISRISSMVQNLCIHFSPHLVTIPSFEDPYLSTPYHPFPSPSALSDPSVDATLRGLGFGYRAKYIQKTAALLCSTHVEPTKWLMGLRQAEIHVAREELLKLHGVGPKVADCILLMSLDKTSIVPVDTHVYQIAVKHYGFRGSVGVKPNMTPKLYTDVATKLTNVWGEYAGWAHSVLFTADLRSFANYGVSPPTPASISEATTAVNTPKTEEDFSDLGNTLSKRKRATRDISITPTAKRAKGGSPTTAIAAFTDSLKEELGGGDADSKQELDVLPDEEKPTLAERVKSRRRRAVEPLGVH